MDIGMAFSIVETGVEPLLSVVAAAAHLTAMAALRALRQQTQTEAPVVVARRVVWAFAAQAATASIQMGQHVLGAAQGPFPKLETRAAKIALLAVMAQPRATRIVPATASAALDTLAPLRATQPIPAMTPVALDTMAPPRATRPIPATGRAKRGIIAQLDPRALSKNPAPRPFTVLQAPLLLFHALLAPIVPHSMPPQYPALRAATALQAPLTSPSALQAHLAAHQAFRTFTAAAPAPPTISAPWVPHFLHLVPQRAIIPPLAHPLQLTASPSSYPRPVACGSLQLFQFSRASPLPFQQALQAQPLPFGRKSLSLPRMS